MLRISFVLALGVFSLLPMLTEGPMALAQCVNSPGAVVQLVGTPHLFISDAQGVLHWGGDTRALAGRTINWNNRCEVRLDALRAAQRGDPWLSAGLPKVGDPIYLAKWEDSEASPRLLRVQSIPDVELFGINTNNYLNFVLDRATWQQRYGFEVGRLQVGPLASADSFAWSAADQAAYAQLLTNMENLESAALFQATSAGIDPATSLPSLAECERQGLDEFEARRNAGTALRITQDCIARLAGGGPVPTPPTTGAPQTPGNVRVAALSPTQHRISWNDTPNETGFRIYGGETQFTTPTTLVANVGPNTTTHDLAGRSPGAIYCYSVTAVNAAGESPASAPVCSGTSSQGAPAAPVNLRMTQLGVNAVQLDWIDVSTNEDGFRILRGGQVIASVGQNVTTHVDLGIVTPGCYTVVAFNSLGQSPSNSVCPGGSSAAPAAPTNLHLSPVGGGNATRLDWTDNSTNEEGFRIIRGNQTVTTLGPNTTTFVDGGIVPTPGCYTVIAFNSAGQSSSNQACSSL